MKQLTLLFKSFRLLNVFSMLLLMIGLRYYFWKHLTEDSVYSLGRNAVEFVLLLVAVGIISAAGYLVNDIFDVKADRINKPEKTLPYYTPFLWGIYIGMNLIAVSLCFYLADNSLTQFILFCTIVTLFLYSFLLQKLPLLGNVAVALLAGFLPLLYYSFDARIKLHSHFDLGFPYLNIILFYTFLGFGITLLRELVKDLEDISGDKAANYKTFPVLVGVTGSQILFYFVTVLFVLVLFYFNEFLSPNFLMDNIYYYLPVFIGLFFSVYQVFLVNYSKASLILKYTLFFGVLILFIL